MFPDLKSIERRRRSLGITQKQLALATQVSQSLITKVERGLIIPNYDTASRIFVFLEGAEKKDEKTAGEIMHKGVITIDSGDRIAKVASLAKKHSVSQFPVIEKGVVIGAVTTKDIIEAPKNAEVRDFVREPFPTISIKTPSNVAKMLLKHYSAVLVLNKSSIEGIITAEDFL
ncbi:MAG: CBS domain-containing protein [Candidatus Aenigmatarchaeota archaeon]